ncbi:hypothetical protein ACFL5O_00400 [Myxococcota bacterium]
MKRGSCLWPEWLAAVAVAGCGGVVESSSRLTDSDAGVWGGGSSDRGGSDVGAGRVRVPVGGVNGLAGQTAVSSVEGRAAPVSRSGATPAPGDADSRLPTYSPIVPAGFPVPRVIPVSSGVGASPSCPAVEPRSQPCRADGQTCEYWRARECQPGCYGYVVTGFVCANGEWVQSSGVLAPCSCGPDWVARLEAPETPAVPVAWRCEARTYGSADGCDCGCGAWDPDCDGHACIDPGCRAPNCDACHRSDGAIGDCAVSAPRPLEAWACSQRYRGTGDGCDCGCGAPDPDCGSLGCSEPGCVTSGCEYCYESGGRGWPCELISYLQSFTRSVEPPLPSTHGDWTCDPVFYGTYDGCDCGCGAPDPDCGSVGCAEPGCVTSGCEYCYAPLGLPVACPWLANASALFQRPRQDLFSAWTCHVDFYGTGDGCDCGCGLADPDCQGVGCPEAGCYVPACEYCYGESGDSWLCDWRRSSDSSGLD